MSFQEKQCHKWFIQEKLCCSLNHIWHEPLFYKLLMLDRMFQNNSVHLNFYVKPLASIIGASWTRNSAALNILILWYVSKTNPLLSQFLNTYSNFAHTLFYIRPNSTSLKIAAHPFFSKLLSLNKTNGSTHICSACKNSTVCNMWRRIGCLSNSSHNGVL